MNDYFCEVGQKLSQKIVKLTNLVLTLPKMNENFIFIKPTNAYEVANIINALKLKNGGVDKINAKTLKILSVHIVQPLT